MGSFSRPRAGEHAGERRGTFLLRFCLSGLSQENPFLHICHLALLIHSNLEHLHSFVVPSVFSTLGHSISSVSGSAEQAIEAFRGRWNLSRRAGTSARSWCALKPAFYLG